MRHRFRFRLAHSALRASSSSRRPTAGASWSGKPTVIEQYAPTTWQSVRSRRRCNAWPSAPAVGCTFAWEGLQREWRLRDSRSIKIASSLDNGASFAPSVSVSALTAIGDGADLQGFVRANEYPAIAIGKGKKDNRRRLSQWTSWHRLCLGYASRPPPPTPSPNVEFARSTDRRREPGRDR